MLTISWSNCVYPSACQDIIMLDPIYSKLLSNNTKVTLCIVMTYWWTNFAESCLSQKNARSCTWREMKKKKRGKKKQHGYTICSYLRLADPGNIKGITEAASYCYMSPPQSSKSAPMLKTHYINECGRWTFCKHNMIYAYIPHSPLTAASYLGLLSGNCISLHVRHVRSKRFEIWLCC